MATITNTAWNTINTVIKLCRDGEQAFAAAAEVVDRDELKTELLRHSHERAGFAAALANAIAGKSYAGHPFGPPSSCAIQPGWMDVPHVKAGDNVQTMLAACEGREDSAAEAYAEAMTASLPGRIAELVSNQYPVIKANHDRMRSLRVAADQR